MAAYVTQKTWSTGEILFAADLNAEVTAVKNAVNSIDAVQINSGAVGTTELAASAVTGPKIASEAVTYDNIPVNDILSLGSVVNSWDDSSQSTISTFPFLSTAAEAVPKRTDARILFFGHIEIGGLIGTFFRLQLEVDRDNDGTYEATLAGYFGASAGGAAGEPGQAAGQGESVGAYQTHPFNITRLDTGPFSVDVPVHYRFRLTRIQGTSPLTLRTTSLYALCINV